MSNSYYIHYLFSNYLKNGIQSKGVPIDPERALAHERALLRQEIYQKKDSVLKQGIQSELNQRFNYYLSPFLTHLAPGSNQKSLEAIQQNFYKKAERTWKNTLSSLRYLGTFDADYVNINTAQRKLSALKTDSARTLVGSIQKRIDGLLVFFSQSVETLRSFQNYEKYYEIFQRLENEFEKIKEEVSSAAKNRGAIWKKRINWSKSSIDESTFLSDLNEVSAWAYSYAIQDITDLTLDAFGQIAVAKTNKIAETDLQKVIANFVNSFTFNNGGSSEQIGISLDKTDIDKKVLDKILPGNFTFNDSSDVYELNITDSGDSSNNRLDYTLSYKDSNTDKIITKTIPILNKKLFDFQNDSMTISSNANALAIMQSRTSFLYHYLNILVQHEDENGSGASYRKTASALIKTIMVYEGLRGALMGRDDNLLIIPKQIQRNAGSPRNGGYTVIAVRPIIRKLIEQSIIANRSENEMNAFKAIQLNGFNENGIAQMNIWSGKKMIKDRIEALNRNTNILSSFAANNIDIKIKLSVAGLESIGFNGDEAN